MSRRLSLSPSGLVMDLCLATSVLVMAACMPVDHGAQQPARLPRVAYMTPGVEPPPGEADAFLEGLKALGYVDGKNVLIESRFARGDASRLSEFATEFVAMGADVIIANGEQAARDGQHATSSIPIALLSRSGLC